MHSHFLPIDKNALRHLQVPLHHVLAHWVGAAHRLCEFVLLFDGADGAIANFADKAADEEFGLHFGGACDSALNGHHLAQVLGFKVSEFVDLG